MSTMKKDDSSKKMDGTNNKGGTKPNAEAKKGNPTNDDRAAQATKVENGKKVMGASKNSKNK